MITDPEIDRWRKVRNDFDRKFKSVEAMADYLMAQQKRDKDIVYGSPATYNRSARRQVKRPVRTKAKKSSNHAVRKVPR